MTQLEESIEQFERDIKAAVVSLLEDTAHLPKTYLPLSVGLALPNVQITVLVEAV